MGTMVLDWAKLLGAMLASVALVVAIERLARHRERQRAPECVNGGRTHYRDAR